mgnify:FL=1
MKSKKLNAMLLASVLAVTGCCVTPATAVFAQEESVQEGYKLFMERDGKYKVQIPDTYKEMDSQVMADATETMIEDDMLDDYGYNTDSLEGGSNASAATYLYPDGGDMSVSINVQISEALATRPELAVVYFPQLLEEVKKQYLDMGVPEEDIHLLDTTKHGDNTWAGLTVKFMETDMSQYMYAAEDATYIATFTGIEDETIEKFLSTFSTDTGEV